MAYTLRDLGVFLGTTGRWREAEAFLQPALEIEERKFGRNNILVKSTLFHLDTCIVHQPNASLRDSMGVTDTIQGSDYDIVELDGTARAAYILDHFSL